MESTLNETEKALDTTEKEFLIGSQRPSIHIQKDLDNLFDLCPRMLKTVSGLSFTIYNAKTSPPLCTVKSKYNTPYSNILFFLTV